jgi:hypothetical protein
VYRSEQEPTWQVPLWTLVQDPHTDAHTTSKEMTKIVTKQQNGLNFDRRKNFAESNNNY